MRKMLYWLIMLVIGGFLQANDVKNKASNIVFRVYDKSFESLIDSTQSPVLLYDKGVWLEGPQVLPSGNVVLSDVKANAVLMLRYDIYNAKTQAKIQTWLKPSHFQNGHALDKEGRLIAASHGKRAIEIFTQKGEWKVLIDSYQGKKFNSPNDVIVDSDGEIWFSDPRFGLNNPLESYGGKEEQGGDFLYRYSPATQNIVRLNTPLVKAPNGLALSPDEKILYVADSELAYDFNSKILNHQIVAYDIAQDKSLHNGRILAVIDVGIPDGIKVDAKGNIWSSSGRGIQVFNPEGRRIGEIVFPQLVGNLAFSLNDSTLRALRQRGGEVLQDFSQSLLYVTSGDRLYVLKLKVQSGIKR